MDAKQVINELSYKYENAKKLLADDLLIECLNEELDIMFNNTDLLESFATFKIDEHGEPVYYGISQIAVANLISIKLVNERRIKELQEAKEKAIIKSQDEILENMSKIELDKKKHELLDYLLKSKK